MSVRGSTEGPEEDVDPNSHRLPARSPPPLSRITPGDHTGPTVHRPSFTSLGQWEVRKLLVGFHPELSWGGISRVAMHGGVQENPFDPNVRTPGEREELSGPLTGVGLTPPWQEPPLLGEGWQTPSVFIRKTQKWGAPPRVMATLFLPPPPIDPGPLRSQKSKWKEIRVVNEGALGACATGGPGGGDLRRQPLLVQEAEV